MVRNGYKIKITNGLSLNEFIDNIRTELKEKTMDIAKKLVVYDVEKLWDAKFIDCVQYEKSILELATTRVSEKMNAVANGFIFDGRFDLRSTMNIVEISDDEIIVLFNTSNDELREYFESIPEVSSYKYYADEIEEDITEEENNNRGLFWQSKYQSCNWKTSLLGLSAQITLQPNLEGITYDATEFKDYLHTKEERMIEYINSRIVVERVGMFIGNVPIDKISPIVLEEFFREAYKYLNSPNGQREFNKIKEKIECGFVPIDVSLISLSE